MEKRKRKKPTLNVLEARHRLALIEGQKENKIKEGMVEKMRKMMKAVLALMAILTAIYVSAVVYANVNSNYDVVYAAFEYESETPPTNWYTPEQLGIVKIIEYGENGSYWLHIVVDPKQEPFPLQEEQPIFLYNSTFYQVSPLWVTPGLPESVKQWQIPIGGVLGVGWVLTGALSLKGRKP